MDLNALQKIIQEGESQCIEFKKSTSQLKAAAETVCAFLNSKGGIVLIGVDGKGQLIGLNVSDNTHQEIARELKKIEPKPQVEVHYVNIGGDKKIIAMEVSSGHHVPYAYDGRPFDRNQSTTERMTQHHYEQLIVKRGQLNHSWETQAAYNCDINSLDHEEIRQTIREGIVQNRIASKVLDYSIEDILTKLELIQHGSLINASMVLFAKNRSPDYSQSMIRLARFRGIDKLGDFIDNQQAYGNAFQLISAALDFTNRHLPIASYFEPGRWQRRDQPAVPNLALREALINAISHRDYTNNSSIGLAIYDDRLEIWNSGELPSKLTLEDLKKQHNSYPRNKIIATVFYQRGWVESWGTGTLRMAGFCKDNGTPEPEFEEYSGGFSIVFKFKEPMHTGTKKDHEYLFDQLTPRQKEIIYILKNVDTMTASEIMKQLQDPPAKRTLRDDLSILKNCGIIDFSGRAKTAIWFLKNKI